MNYDNAYQTALRLLTLHGRDVTLTKVTAGAYSTATLKVTNTTSDVTVKAVDFAVSGETEVNQTMIKADDRYALVAYASDISTSDKLTMGGVTWSIVAVKTLAPAGTVVLHKVHIRK